MVALLTLALIGQVFDDSDRPPMLRRTAVGWGGAFEAFPSTSPPDICGCNNLVARDGTALTDVRGSAATCERKGFATTGIENGDLVTCGSGLPRIVPHTVTGAPSVYLESTADNYELRSREFDNVIWTKAGVGVAAPVVTADYAIGVFGEQTADRIQFAACPLTTNTSVLSQTITPVSSPFSGSVYCKALSGTPSISACVYSTGAGDRLCTQHVLNTLTWVRILSENRVFTTNTDFTIGCENRVAFYAGNANTGAADVICEAIQVETGAYATSYIPTTSSIVTRSADEMQLNRSYATTTSGFCTAATIEFRSLTALVAGAGLWAPSLSSTTATSIGAPYMWPYTISTGSNIGIDGTGAASPAGYSSSAIDPLAGPNRYIAAHNGAALVVCRNGTCAVNATPSTWAATTFASLRLNVNNTLKQAAAWSTIQFDSDWQRCTR